MTSETIALELPAELYRELQAQADEAAKSPAALVTELLEANRRALTWQRNIKSLQDMIAADGGLFPGLTREQIQERLRQTRQEIWDEEYAHLYR